MPKVYAKIRFWSTEKSQSIKRAKWVSETPEMISVTEFQNISNPLITGGFLPFALALPDRIQASTVPS
jgi:hypothetical protein